MHWNFFFTLAFVALLISVLDVPVEYNAVGGIALILLYQCALSKFGLAEYIEHHPRSNLWHQNREGILSSIGYTSLYLLGARLGREIWKPRSTMTEWRRFTLQLWIVDTICWIVTLVSDHYVVAASRRMANLTYVLSVMAINVQNIASALTIACITRPVSNCITEAVNYNGLAIFLLVGHHRYSLTSLGQHRHRTGQHVDRHNLHFGCGSRGNPVAVHDSGYRHCCSFISTSNSFKVLVIY